MTVHWRQVCLATAAMSPESLFVRRNAVARAARRAGNDVTCRTHLTSPLLLQIGIVAIIVAAPGTKLQKTGRFFALTTFFYQHITFGLDHWVPHHPCMMRAEFYTGAAHMTQFSAFVATS